MNISQVAIITVTSNSSKTIGKMLNSLCMHKKYVREVMVIDNNSIDQEKTKQICNSFEKKFEIIFISNDRNEGFGKSCNYGANNTRGEFMLFLNPDTELQINSLKVLFEHYDFHKADIMGGRAINYINQVHGSVVRKPTISTGLFEFCNLGKLFNIDKPHADFYYEDLQILSSEIDQEVDAVSGAYMLVNKKAFSSLHGFDENIFMYLEDVDLCIRAKNLGLKVMFCPHSVIWHEGGASSQNKYKIHHQAWFDSRKYYFKKHFGTLTNSVIQPLYTVEEFLLKKIKKV